MACLRAVWGGGTFVAAMLTHELIISMADASSGRAAVHIALLAAVAVLAVPVGAAVLAMRMPPPTRHYPTDQPIHVYRTADKKRAGADCTLSLTVDAMVIDEAGKQKRIAWAWLEPVTCDGECVMLDWDDGRKRRKLSLLAAAGEQNPTVRRFAAVEVTVAAYLKCVDSGRCFAPATRNWCNGTGQPNHPVNCVRWNEAKVYCEWVGKRLPTEEEWEFAAKGTDGRHHPWGNEEPGGRPCWDRMDGTCEVDTHKLANGPFGLADMAGNVWEWTSSASSPDYATPKRTDSVSLRGGGWRDDDPSYLRSGYRAGTPPTHSSADLGFRCAR